MKQVICPLVRKIIFNLIFRRARMEGFIVLDYEKEFPIYKSG